MPNVGKPQDRQVPGPPRTSGHHDKPLPAGGEIAGSMKTEEPLGWDQAPQAIDDPEKKRHSRPDGVGGIESAKQTKENNPLNPNDPT